MTRTFFTFALALLCAGSASAQVETIPNQKDVGSACILATDGTVWGSLGLSAEQIDKVQSIQTQCKTECLGPLEGGEKDPEMSGAALKHYEDELRKLLTEEQYTKWQKWCNDRPGRT
ncbi:MAG: hypothetical protein WAU70_07235 [Flavobacteriales bacterium]